MSTAGMPVNSVFGSMFSALLVLVIIVGLYFLPALVANRRKHLNCGAIWVLNNFLGWTFLGWVIALVWAFTNNVEEKGR